MRKSRFTESQMLATVLRGVLIPLIDFVRSRQLIM